MWHVPARRALLRQPVVVAALGWLMLVSGMAVFAPFLAPAGPMAVATDRQLQPPSTAAWLGTDPLGRDILARLVWGSRLTLFIGLVGLAFSVGLGLPLGVSAGWIGGWFDMAVMRVVEVLLAFPSLLLAMTVVAVVGRGLLPVAIAIGIAAAPAYARVARSAVLEVRVQPYIEAAYAIGAGQWHILRRHVLPNVMGPLLAFAAAQLGWVLLNGSALNFLGLGTVPGVAEWGAMLAEGRAYLRNAPWVSVFPGLFLTLTVLSANLLSDGILESFRLSL